MHIQDPIIICIRNFYHANVTSGNNCNSMYTKNARTNSTVKMIGFITIFVLKIWLSLTSAEFKSEGFKLTFVKSFDTIETSQNMKTLIECCSFCLAKSPCEGVQYDGKSCTSLSNVLTTTIGTSKLGL